MNKKIKKKSKKKKKGMDVNTGKWEILGNLAEMNQQPVCIVYQKNVCFISALKMFVYDLETNKQKSFKVKYFYSIFLYLINLFIFNYYFFFNRLVAVKNTSVQLDMPLWRDLENFIFLVVKEEKTKTF